MARQAKKLTKATLQSLRAGPGSGVANQAVIGFLCVLALIPSAPALGAEPAGASVSELFSEAQRSVLRVGLKGEDGPAPGMERWLGTAFVVDDECTLATAKHLFSGIDMKRVVVQAVVLDGERTRLLIADPAWHLLAEGNDLAFLGFARDHSKNPCLAFDLAPLLLGLDSEAARIGEEVIVVGHPAIVEGYDLRTPVLRTGHIAAKGHWRFGIAPETEMYLLDLIGVPGFSGSPVLRLETREVIAVVFGPGPTKRSAGFEWATKISKTTYGIVARLRSRLE